MNGTVKWIALGIVCVSVLATSIYAFAATKGQSDTNAVLIAEMKLSQAILAAKVYDIDKHSMWIAELRASNVMLTGTVHELDKKLERVLTILDRPAGGTPR